MEKITKIIITALILAAVILAAPFGTGMLVEKQFHRLLQETYLNLEAYPNAEFKLVSYKRGWFKSEAEGILTVKNLKIDDKALPPVQIVFHDHIKHGPFIITKNKEGKPNFWFGQAISKTYLQQISGVKISPLPLHAGTTSIGFRGELETVIDLDKVNVEFPNFALALEEFKGHLGITHDRKKIINQLHLKNAVVTNKNNLFKFDLKNLGIGAELSKNQQGLWLGDKKLEADSVMLSLQNNTYALKGVYNKTHSFEHDNKIKLDIRLNIRSAGVNDKLFGPHRLVLNVDGIDASVLSKLNDILIKLSHDQLNKVNIVQTQTPVKTGDALKKEILFNRVGDLTSELIKKGFSIEVKNLEINTAWGILNAHALFKLPNTSSKVAPGPFPLSLLASLLNIELELNAEIPVGLAKMAFESRYYKLVHAQNKTLTPEMEKQSMNELADKHLAKLVADGWFIQKTDKYEISLTFKNGEFLVNRKPLKPQRIFELAPMPMSQNNTSDPNAVQSSTQEKTSVDSSVDQKLPTQSEPSTVQNTTPAMQQPVKNSVGAIPNHSVDINSNETTVPTAASGLEANQLPSASQAVDEKQ